MKFKDFNEEQVDNTFENYFFYILRILKDKLFRFFELFKLNLKKKS